MGPETVATDNGRDEMGPENVATENEFKKYFFNHKTNHSSAVIDM